MSPNSNVSDFRSAEQNGWTQTPLLHREPLNLVRHYQIEIWTNQSASHTAGSCTAANTPSINHAGPHYPDSKASENQSKHEPRIIAVCKAHSLRSWRGFRATAVGQQCVNRGRMGGGGGECGGSNSVGRSSLWAARNAGLCYLDVSDRATRNCCVQTQPCERPACGVKVATDSPSAHSDTWWSDEWTNLTIRAGAIGDNMVIKRIGWVQVCVGLPSCSVQSLNDYSKNSCPRTVTLTNHKFRASLCTS